jgi:uncharacterized protein (UPF0264 family)
MVVLALAAGCASSMRLAMIASGARHLQARAEYPKVGSCDKLFGQMAAAAANSGLTVLSVNKDVGLVTMEKLQSDQVMRFTSQISEHGDACAVNLTLDFKKHTTMGQLQKNAVAVLWNLQEASGADPNKVTIAMDAKAQALPAWKSELGM